MEFIQHLLGACGDNHTHFDLTDMMYMGGGAMGLYTIRYYAIVYFYLIKSYIKKQL